MASTRGDRRGADVVHSLFGTNLQQQGRGFYVALELLAIVRGVLDAGEQSALDPNASPIRYRRQSHDFARRIATDSDVKAELLSHAVQGPATLDTVRALLSSLVVDIPGRRRAPQWFAAHLYPFVGELIHYDAVERRKQPSIERYVFRDAGGWAYKVLREDADAARRERVRSGLVALVEDSETALGRVASALHAHDEAPQSGPFTDESEASAVVNDDKSPWPRIMRAGVDRIVSRHMAPRAKRIEQIMHWVPYCVARHQLALALHELDAAQELIPVDATTDPNPLRAQSQLMLDRSRWAIAEALIKVARDRRDAADDSDKSNWARLTVDNAPFTASPRAFFSETLAAVGALNATTGRRYFTFKAPMLEALVAATVEPDQDMEFHDFCQLLADDYFLVVDQKAAQEAKLTTEIDAGVFKDNAGAFQSQLASTGLLTHYSDATSLVHGEPR